MTIDAVLSSREDGQLIVHPQIYEQIFGRRAMAKARLRHALGRPPSRSAEQELLCTRLPNGMVGIAKASAPHTFVLFVRDPAHNSQMLEQEQKPPISPTNKGGSATKAKPSKKTRDKQRRMLTATLYADDVTIYAKDQSAPQ